MTTYTLSLSEGDKIQIKSGTANSRDDNELKLDCELGIQGLMLVRELLKQNPPAIDMLCKDNGLAAAVCTINAMIDAYWDEQDRAFLDQEFKAGE